MSIGRLNDKKAVKDTTQWSITQLLKRMENETNESNVSGAYSPRGIISNGFKLH